MLKIKQLINVFIAAPIKLLWTMLAVKVIKPALIKLNGTMLKWHKFRKLKYYKLVYDRFKLAEGKLLPWWAVGLRFIMMPADTGKHLLLRWMLRDRMVGGYNVMYDYWDIEGVRYSGELFRAFGLWNLNTEIKIVKRDGWLVTIEKVNKGDAK